MSTRKNKNKYGEKQMKLKRGNKWKSETENVCTHTYIQTQGNREYEHLIVTHR